jgi:hypothetical protein
MKKMATDNQIPTSMAPPEDGVCDRCGKQGEICSVFYRRVSPLKAKFRDLCADCRRSCGQGSRWEYAGGGDVVPFEKAS